MTSLNYSIHHGAGNRNFPDSMIASGETTAITYDSATNPNGSVFWTLVVDRATRQAAVTLHWFLADNQLQAIKDILNREIKIRKKGTKFIFPIPEVKIL